MNYHGTFRKLFWQYLLKLKVHVSFVPEILPLGIYSIEIKGSVNKAKCIRLSSEANVQNLKEK